MSLCMQSLKAMLREEFPALRRIETSGLHKGVAGAKHSFIKVPGTDNKLDQLLQVQASVPNPFVKRTKTAFS